jgi:hypothetical protein
MSVIERLRHILAAQEKNRWSREGFIEEIERIVAEDGKPWADQKDRWSVEIAAAHPMRQIPGAERDHDRYSEAIEMVGARHSKYALVDLVNWLLKRIDDAKAKLAERVDRHDADGKALIEARGRLTDAHRLLLSIRRTATVAGQHSCKHCDPGNEGADIWGEIIAKIDKLVPEKWRCAKCNNEGDGKKIGVLMCCPCGYTMKRVV